MRHPGLLVLALGFPGLLPGSSVHDERPTTGLRSLAYHSNGITTGQASQDARTLQAAHSHIPLEPWERRPPQGMPYRLRQDADVSSYVETLSWHPRYGSTSAFGYGLSAPPALM